MRDETPTLCIMRTARNPANPGLSTSTFMWDAVWICVLGFSLYPRKPGLSPLRVNFYLGGGLDPSFTLSLSQSLCVFVFCFFIQHCVHLLDFDSASVCFSVCVCVCLCLPVFLSLLPSTSLSLSSPLSNFHLLSVRKNRVDTGVALHWLDVPLGQIFTLICDADMCVWSSGLT